MLVEVKVERLTLDRTTQSPVVVLREDAGERALPIWIGAGEASAIHMQLAHMSVGRPLTHDLLVSAIRGLGATLSRVVITRVEQNTYYARLELRLEGRDVELDARPSDSIAVALRTGSPIFAEDELLDLVKVEIADGDDVSTLGSTGSTGPASSSGSGGIPGLSGASPIPGFNPSKAPPPLTQEGMSPAELQEYLRKLNPEDFGRFNP